jgi:hypothetical protein
MLGMESARRNSVLESNNTLQNLRKTRVTRLPPDLDISMALDNYRHSGLL